MLQHVGSSFLTRDGTQAPVLGAWSLSHWTIRGAPRVCFLFVCLFVFITTHCPSKGEQNNQMYRFCPTSGNHLLKNGLPLPGQCGHIWLVLGCDIKDLIVPRKKTMFTTSSVSENSWYLGGKVDLGSGHSPVS